MKKLISALFLLTLTSVSMAATTPYLNVTKDHTVDLKKIDANEALIVVDYPGAKLSKICALALKTDSKEANVLENVLSNIKVTHAFFDVAKDIDHDIVDGTLTIQLVSDTYVDGINLQTNSGQSIKKVLQKVLGKNSLIATAVDCE